MTAVEFSAMLLSGATGALPYIAGGVAAGATLLAIGLGISKGLGALRKVGGK